MRTLALGLGSLLFVSSGCSVIDAIGPQNRFADTVHQLNDEARWGRVDLASERVVLAHRRAFLAQHRAWGRNVRVADADVTNLALGDEGRATSLVTYEWIDERTMEVTSTIVRQAWIGEGEGFLLTGEEIVAGDPGLLDGAPVLGGDPEDVGANAPAPSSGGEVATDADVAPSGTVVTSAPSSAPRQRDAQGMLVAR